MSIKVWTVIGMVIACILSIVIAVLATIIITSSNDKETPKEPTVTTTESPVEPTEDELFAVAISEALGKDVTVSELRTSGMIDLAHDTCDTMLSTQGDTTLLRTYVVSFVESYGKDKEGAAVLAAVTTAYCPEVNAWLSDAQYS